jgi:hypothetical protein
MRFKELPAERRPNSEASGNTRSDGGAHVGRDLLSSVIDRWRSATMSHRMSEDEYADYGAPSDTPPLQPSPPQTPAYQPPPQPAPAAQPSALRASLLKKPLDANSLGGAPTNPGYPPRFR